MQLPNASAQPRPESAGPHWTWPLAPVAALRQRPRHARRSLMKTVQYGLALALTAAVAFAGAGAGAAAAQLSGNVTAVDANLILASDYRPTIAEAETAGDPQPMNILVLGVDGYVAEGDEPWQFDGDGARSDTAIVMHVSADREHVAMISIPRDSIVDIPRCPTSTPGLAAPPQAQMRFNHAFATGYDTGGDVASGALCAMATVEQLTNVRLDGFIALDFTGFEYMVDALGGVVMTFEQRLFAPMEEPLVIEAGTHRLNGWQILMLMRARIGVGDGSDLQRIERQQEVMGAIASEALGSNLLTDMPRLVRFLNAATRSMTASTNFATVPGLASFANSMSGLDVAGIEFVTVPHALHPDNHNVVIWTGAAADLWRDVRYDQFFDTGDSPDSSDHDGASLSDYAAVGASD